MERTQEKEQLEDEELHHVVDVWTRTQRKFCEDRRRGGLFFFNYYYYFYFSLEDKNKSQLWMYIFSFHAREEERRLCNKHHCDVRQEGTTAY